MAVVEPSFAINCACLQIDILRQEKEKAQAREQVQGSKQPLSPLGQVGINARLPARDVNILTQRADSGMEYNSYRACLAWGVRIHWNVY